MDDNAELRQLEERLADLRARLPAHTPRPAMLMEFEELEEQVARLREKLQRKG